MFKFGAILLVCLAASSIHAGVVLPRETSSHEATLDNSEAQIISEASSEEQRFPRQLDSYGSPQVFQTPQGIASPPVSFYQTAYTSSPPVAVAVANSPTTTASPTTTGNPLSALTSLLSSFGSKAGSNGAGGVQDVIGGAIGTATSGVRTVLEVKRDLILPLILGILNLGQNVANSDVLRTIVDVKVNAAKTVLSIGPFIIEVLGGFASTAGDVTSGIFKTLICNIICPIHRAPSTCRAESSCDSSTASSSSSSSKSTPEIARPVDYVLT
eukprot:TRINITY_DN271_c0_g1_i1.p1 TRINITY_DN271_c0_g1~~TRINITY_DN271_c0_g1_i1.p1  ORF type:complete len:286 (+),score=56.58 TRINITY_DN271_c0_g1_i1:49-858(+)